MWRIELVFILFLLIDYYAYWRVPKQYRKRFARWYHTLPGGGFVLFDRWRNAGGRL